jgi:hypothetical protein
MNEPMGLQVVLMLDPHVGDLWLCRHCDLLLRWNLGRVAVLRPAYANLRLVACVGLVREFCA